MRDDGDAVRIVTLSGATVVMYVPADVIVAEIKRRLLHYAECCYMTQYDLIAVAADHRSLGPLNDLLPLNQLSTGSPAAPCKQLRMAFTPYSHRAVRDHINQLRSLLAEPLDEYPLANAKIENWAPPVPAGDSTARYPVLVPTHSIHSIEAGCTSPFDLHPAGSVLDGALRFSPADATPHHLLSCAIAPRPPLPSALPQIAANLGEPLPAERMAGNLVFFSVAHARGSVGVAGHAAGFYQIASGDLLDTAKASAVHQTLFGLLCEIIPDFLSDFQDLAALRAAMTRADVSVAQRVEAPAWVSAGHPPVQRDVWRATEYEYAINQPHDPRVPQKNWGSHWLFPVSSDPAASVLTTAVLRQQLYAEFLSLAVQGVTLAVEGTLIPLDATVPFVRQVFMFNGIAISLCEPEDDDEAASNPTDAAPGVFAAPPWREAHRELEISKVLMLTLGEDSVALPNASIDYMGHRCWCSAVNLEVYDKFGSRKTAFRPTGTPPDLPMPQEQTRSVVTPSLVQAAALYDWVLPAAPPSADEPGDGHPGDRMLPAGVCVFQGRDERRYIESAYRLLPQRRVGAGFTAEEGGAAAWPAGGLGQLKAYRLELLAAKACPPREPVVGAPSLGDIGDLADSEAELPASPETIRRGFPTPACEQPRAPQITQSTEADTVKEAAAQPTPTTPSVWDLPLAPQITQSTEADAVKEAAAQPTPTTPSVWDLPLAPQIPQFTEAKAVTTPSPTPTCEQMQAPRITESTEAKVVKEAAAQPTPTPTCDLPLAPQSTEFTAAGAAAKEATTQPTSTTPSPAPAGDLPLAPRIAEATAAADAVKAAPEQPTAPAVDPAAELVEEQPRTSGDAGRRGSGGKSADDAAWPDGGRAKDGTAAPLAANSSFGTNEIESSGKQTDLHSNHSDSEPAQGVKPGEGGALHSVLCDQVLRVSRGLATGRLACGDGAVITEVFHANGLPMQALAAVMRNLAPERQHRWICRLLHLEIVVRSAKPALRRALRATRIAAPAAAAADFFNAFLFAPSSTPSEQASRRMAAHFSAGPPAAYPAEFSQWRTRTEDLLYVTRGLCKSVGIQLALRDYFGAGVAPKGVGSKPPVVFRKADFVNVVALPCVVSPVATGTADELMAEAGRDALVENAEVAAQVAICHQLRLTGDVRGAAGVSKRLCHTVGKRYGWDSSAMIPALHSHAHLALADGQPFEAITLYSQAACVAILNGHVESPDYTSSVFNASFALQSHLVAKPTPTPLPSYLADLVCQLTAALTAIHDAFSNESIDAATANLAAAHLKSLRSFNPAFAQK
ncbi:hypothetical protein DIPPA_33758 [Diplonema papillatum]|nr:hypothetical protein DIPPA_33758 [Diplonema papillatum]